ncbi:hypothetical protein [Aurantimonas coralicida]|uniref:hypothetical protein n=1 Tax=Aurantimonas coralicida TaxID=182270 RepID=UPI001D17F18B|nr:hypothetical protein [Aurantimonas coralicida]MCC4300178.1 hypothetical protein [Aurantimonas coralicida]
MTVELAAAMIQGWIFLFISEKGGVRKTATLGAFVAHLFEMMPAFPIFEIDDQPRLKRWFGSDVSTLRLPAHDVVRHDDLADQAALAPLLDSILDKVADNIAIDVAGSVDGRVLESMLKMDFCGAAVESGYRIAAFVPYTSESDAIALASRTIERLSVALPGSLIVPVHAEDGGSLRHVTGNTAQRLSHILKSGPQIRHPRILPRALAAAEATGVSPYHLAALSDSEGRTLLFEKGLPRALARGIHSELVMWREEIRLEFDSLPLVPDDGARS